MKKRKLSEPTPRGLPSLKELDKLMEGLDLWEMDTPRSLSSTRPKGYAGLGLSSRKLNRPSFYKGDK